MKICKNDDFRHFRPEKNLSQKPDSAMFLALLIRIFLQNKISEKTIEEISRKCQKTSFSGIFPAFSAGKKCISKIGLRHILGIAILHQYAIWVKIYWEFRLFSSFSKFEVRARKLILGYLLNVIKYFNLGGVGRLPGYIFSLVGLELLDPKVLSLVLKLRVETLPF